MPNLLDRLQTFLFGAAIGRAASDGVTPALEPVRQTAWQKNKVRVLDPGTAAEAVARRFIQESEGQDDAARNGYDVQRFGALTRLAQMYPGLADLDKLSNREILTPDKVKEVLARHGIPEEYVAPLMELFQDLLTPGELAAAIHRGLVPDAGLLLGEQPAPPFNVEAYPVQEIKPIQEAAGSGYDKRRLQVLVGLQGLPMGPHEAAQAFFRKIITHGDYIRAFNTSNMRNEWAQAILDQTRQIPTARDFFENALRGYHDLKWAQEEAKRHGMSEADSLVIYQNQGRPMNVHAIQQALARGAKFNPEAGEIRDPFDAAIVEGNLKPAYYELAKSLRYTLPSVFTIRALAQSGVWSEAKTAERLKWAGWYPQDAEEAAKAWAGGSSAAATSTQAKLATTQARAALKKRYLVEHIDATGVLTGLELLGSDPAEAGHILEMWTLERGWLVAPLTASQIRKLYTSGQITVDEAVVSLERLHYTEQDARDYLTLA